MFGYRNKHRARLIKPWVVSYIQKTKEEMAVNRAEIVKVTNSVTGAKNGETLKHVTDGEVYIKTRFSRTAVKQFLAEIEEESQTDWSSSMVILQQYSLEFEPSPVLSNSEYVLKVNRFKLWDLQEGFSRKGTLLFCMENDQVKTRALEDWNKWREENQTKARGDYSESASLRDESSSVPLSQLLAEMACPSDVEQSVEVSHEVHHGIDSLPDSLLKRLYSPFTQEEFQIEGRHIEALNEITVWKPDYRPSPSLDASEGVSSQAEIRVSSVHTLAADNPQRKHAAEEPQMVRTKTSRLNQIDAEKPDQYQSPGVSQEKSLTHSEVHQPADSEKSRRSKGQQSQISEYSQADSSVWQQELESVHFSCSDESLDFGSPVDHSTQNDAPRQPTARCRRSLRSIQNATADDIANNSIKYLGVISQPIKSPTNEPVSLPTKSQSNSSDIIIIDPGNKIDTVDLTIETSSESSSEEHDGQRNVVSDHSHTSGKEKNLYIGNRDVRKRNTDGSNKSEVKYLGIVTQATKPGNKDCSQINNPLDIKDKTSDPSSGSSKDQSQSDGCQGNTEFDSSSPSLLQQKDIVNSGSSLAAKQNVVVEIAETGIRQENLNLLEQSSKNSSNSKISVRRISFDKQSETSLSSDKSVISPSPEAEVTHFSSFSMIGNASKLISTGIRKAGSDYDKNNTHDSSVSNDCNVGGKRRLEPLIMNLQHAVSSQEKGADSVRTTEQVRDGSVLDKMFHLNSPVDVGKRTVQEVTIISSEGSDSEPAMSNTKTTKDSPVSKKCSVRLARLEINTVLNGMQEKKRKNTLMSDPVRDFIASENVAETNIRGKHCTISDAEQNAQNETIVKDHEVAYTQECISSEDSSVEEEGVKQRDNSPTELDSARTISCCEALNAQNPKTSETKLSHQVYRDIPVAKPSTKWEENFYQWARGYEESGCVISQCSECDENSISMHINDSLATENLKNVSGISEPSKEPDKGKEYRTLTSQSSDLAKSDYSNVCAVSKSSESIMQKQSEKSKICREASIFKDGQNNLSKQISSEESQHLDSNDSPDLLSGTQSFDTEIKNCKSASESIAMPDILSGTQPFDYLSTQTQGFVPDLSNTLRSLSRSSNNSLNDSELLHTHADELQAEENRLKALCKPTGNLLENGQKAAIERKERHSPIKYKLSRGKGRQKCNVDDEIWSMVKVSCAEKSGSESAAEKVSIENQSMTAQDDSIILVSSEATGETSDDLSRNGCKNTASGLNLQKTVTKKLIQGTDSHQSTDRNDTIIETIDFFIANSVNSSKSTKLSLACKNRIAEIRQLDLSNVKVHPIKRKGFSELNTNILRVKHVCKSNIDNNLWLHSSQNSSALSEVETESETSFSETETESEMNFRTEKQENLKTYSKKKVAKSCSESKFPSDKRLNEAETKNKRKEVIVRKVVDGFYRFVRETISTDTFKSFEKGSCIESKVPSSDKVVDIDGAPKCDETSICDEESKDRDIDGSFGVATSKPRKMRKENFPSKETIAVNNEECKFRKDVPCNHNVSFGKSAECKEDQNKMLKSTGEKFRKELCKDKKEISKEEHLRTGVASNSKYDESRKHDSSKKISCKRKHEDSKTESVSRKSIKIASTETDQQTDQTTTISPKQTAIDAYDKCPGKQERKKKHLEGLGMRSSFTQDWVQEQTFELLSSSEESQENDLHTKEVKKNSCRDDSSHLPSNGRTTRSKTNGGQKGAGDSEVDKALLSFPTEQPTEIGQNLLSLELTRDLKQQALKILKQ